MAGGVRRCGRLRLRQIGTERKARDRDDGQRRVLQDGHPIGVHDEPEAAVRDGDTEALEDFGSGRVGPQDRVVDPGG